MQASDQARRRAVAVVLVATILGLLAGSAAGAVNAAQRLSEGPPCEWHGRITRVAKLCALSNSEIAEESAIDFAVIAIGVFMIVILIAFLVGIGWRLLKWALSG